MGNPMPALRKKSVTALAAELKRLCDDFNSREVCDEKIDASQFRKIRAIEAKLIKATFKTSADQKAGRTILASGDTPYPLDWCFFKSDLYMRMQQFA
jgi:hypothetical protein